jgi:protein TonB
VAGGLKRTEEAHLTSPRSRKHALLTIALTIVFVSTGGGAWFIYNLVSKLNKKPPHIVENITLIRPPPPPEELPPPPPEKLDQPLPQDQPDPTPDNAPTPSPQLGLDTEGTAGGDSFGLAARKGGGDLVGAGGAVFAWYTGKLKAEVSDRLSSDAKLRGKKYSVGVRIWIEADGRIKEARITSGSGNHDLDNTITADLVALGRLSESPPLEMPQPITLQIVSRS